MEGSCPLKGWCLSCGAEGSEMRPAGNRDKGQLDLPEKKSGVYGEPAPVAGFQVIPCKHLKGANIYPMPGSCLQG